MTSSKFLTPIIVETLEKLGDEGLVDFRSVLENLLNELMKIERESILGASSYERTEFRKGYSNGFKDKNLQLRSGKLKLKIPQARGISFYPSCLEKGERSEKALKLTIAEMYLNGISTRRVEKVMKELCGMKISSTQVSRFTNMLENELEKFRSRKLKEIVYLYLDAHYEKVRHDGHVKNLAVLKAIGVNKNGHREILGISCSLSEAEIHWRNFLKDLLARGMYGIKLIISDDHYGLKAALRSVLSSVPWQRCLFHLSQNAQSYASKKELRKEIGGAVREIYQAIDLEEARNRMQKVIEKYSKTSSKFCEWLEDNFEEDLTFFNFPKSHRKHIRTVNVVERLNQEIKRRTNVCRLFPNEKSCERLVTAISIDMHEKWSISKKYMNMD